jgi:hypothetical protein
MRTLVLCVVVAMFAAGPLDVWALQKSAPSDREAQALKQMAAAIPLGSRVKAQITSGKRLSGTLMSVSDDAVIIKKRTRLPEPAVTVAFAELSGLELQTSEGMSVGKAVGIGLAAGAGAILTLFAFFAAMGGD